MTSFGAFGKVTSNPSWEATKGLDGKIINGYKINVLQLPVVYGESLDILNGALDDFKPVLVISFGVAPYNEIHLEKEAHNGPFSRNPDNKGYIPEENKIINNETDILYTSLRLENIYEMLVKEGVPVKYSDSAGDYLCNYVFFNLMHQMKVRKWNIPAGFIHVPKISEYFTLELLKESILKTVNTCVMSISNS